MTETQHFTGIVTEHGWNDSHNATITAIVHGTPQYNAYIINCD